MGIDEINPEWIRANLGRVERPLGQGGDRTRGTRGVERADRIEISREGRELAEKHGVTGIGPGIDLPPDVIAEIRERIRDGFYEQPGVAREVARQILERGEL